MEVPLCKPYVGYGEENILKEVLCSGKYVGGEKTSLFENNFSEYIGTKYALSFNSCTSALQAIIQALGIKNKIAVPSFTFVASANAIVTAGCEPVFIDVDSRTFNLDPNSLRKALESYKDIEAVMVVHYAGQSCDMDEIMKIAQEYNLKVIEDSAETCGGMYQNKKTGSFSFGCFSFFPTKNMTTGEGGMITFDESELVGKLKALRGHGIGGEKKNHWNRKAILPGYNFRMGEFNAAIGLIQLEKLDWMNSKRREVAEKYDNFFKKFPQIETPYINPKCKHVYQMYIIKFDESINRDDFVKKLNAKRVGASVHFDPPIHLQPPYINSEKVDLSNTEEVCKKVVTLPIYPRMSEEEIDYVFKCISEILNERR